MRCADKRLLGVLLPLAALGALLGGCSDIYFDRREGVTFYGGDAPAANIIAQTVDPWPPAASNRRPDVNGERMQKAAERYRTNKVTPLQPIGTSSVQFSTQSGASGAPGAPAVGGAPGAGAPAQ
jgi:hypothetical protein